MSGVYAITDGTHHKIGVADDPMKRLRELQTGNPRQLTLVFYVRLPGVHAYELERSAHARLGSDMRAVGEWFSCGLDQAIMAILPLTLTMNFPTGTFVSEPAEDEEGLL